MVDYAHNISIPNSYDFRQKIQIQYRYDLLPSSLNGLCVNLVRVSVDIIPGPYTHTHKGGGGRRGGISHSVQSPTESH